MKEPSVNGPRTDPSSLSKRLLLYVIATCHPKMIHRLEHQTLSEPYIQSLNQVTTFQFDESKVDQGSTVEITNDRLFLVKFVLPASSGLHTKIPKLIQQAKLAEDSKPFQLYTKDTCMEFHELLNELLLGFRTSLNEVAKTRGDPKVPTQGSEEFKKKVKLVMLCGFALHKLAKGAALRTHLKTIAPLLIRTQTRTSMSAPIEEQEEEQEEPDEDLKAVQPFVSKEGVEMPLWRSYVDWLRLIIAHFDAVDILVGYVTGPQFQHNSISVQILVAPPVDQSLLPWRELFTDSTLLPTKTIWDPLSGKDNAAILEFLNKALKPASKAKGVKTCWKMKDLWNTIKNLEQVKSSNLPGWEECATNLLVKLKGLTSVPESDSDLFREVSDDIQALWDSARFFASLGNTQPFFGTLHCEACLASLLNENTTNSKGISAQMKVGYVSNLFLSSVSHFL
jgi:hypothetical protein